jgi:FlaA1/EpsC-like NDP-sugar epimerase
MVRVTRWSVAVKASLDVLAWTASIVFAILVRRDFDVAGLQWWRVGVAVLFTVCIQVFLGALVGLYRNHWRFGSLDEVAALAQTTFGTTAALMAANALIHPHPVSLATPLGAAAAALVSTMAVRYCWRVLDQRRRRPSHAGTRRVLVFGAGDGAAQLLGSMLRNPKSNYLPVALLDDDPARRNLRIMGVKVWGDRSAISRVADALQANMLVMAIPSASSELIREVTFEAQAAGLEVRTLPPTDELLDGRATASDLRVPTIADLLGRRQVETDLEAISHYVTGRRVLVTGAGGSIGSELCRQLHRLEPAELMMLDRDESALHDVQLSLDGRGLLDSPDLILVDIRDGARVEEIFVERRPQVVFHAAALKHLPLLEAHPGEAVKTNVWGTYNLLRAAARVGVERFVNISTDKAANPCSVLGYSKRIAERLTATVAEESDTGRYLSVRFGNVLGSRGSMLGAFTAQIEAGGPVSVTHRDVTRYFMTVEEAVQLVIQAGALGDSGEALVLDMGEPVRIADVARRMIEESGRDIDIVFTGLRPGEKLHEVLFADDECGTSPLHPLISHVRVPALQERAMSTLSATGSRDDIIYAMRRLAGLLVDLAIDEDEHDSEVVALQSGR